jgi:hypothetical protein
LLAQLLIGGGSVSFCQLAGALFAVQGSSKLFDLFLTRFSGFLG